MAIVICLRDPDYGNEFKIYGTPEPLIVDVDYGRVDLYNEAEFAEWRHGLILHIHSLDVLETDEGTLAAKFLRFIIAEAEENYGHQAAVDTS